MADPKKARDPDLLKPIGIGILLAIITFPLAIFQEAVNFRKWLGLDLKVSRQASFTCQKLPDPQKGGVVWSVVFESPGRFGLNPRRQTWLRVVEEMGDDWNEERRCGEIADRLTVYAKDDLLGFYYRKAEHLTHQYVICAETELVPIRETSDCPIVVTLVPKADPYEALKNVAGALMPNGDAAYQCANSDRSLCTPKDIAYIPVRMN